MRIFALNRLAYIDELGTDPEIDKLIPSDNWINLSPDGDSWVDNITSLVNLEDNGHFRIERMQYVANIGTRLSTHRNSVDFNPKTTPKSLAGDGALYYSPKFNMGIQFKKGLSKEFIDAVLKEQFRRAEVDNESGWFPTNLGIER